MKRPAAALEATQDRSQEYRKRNAKREYDGRSRVGRKQSRTGRKDKRSRPRQNLRVLNLQRPWARLLLTGSKLVEVRRYPLRSYLNEDLYVLETKGPGAAKDFHSRIIGIIRFGEDFEYKDVATFEADEARHCIPRDSAFAWAGPSSGKRYGWVADKVELLTHTLPPPKVKGMIGAKKTSRRVCLEQ